MPNIDELSIEIEGSAKKASDTIDSLVGKLDTLVGRIKNVTTTPVKINIDTNALKNVNTLKFSIEKALNKVDINTSKIGDKLAKSFGIAGNKAAEQISKQFSGILENAVDKFDGGNLKVSGKAIGELAENIAKSGKIARGELSESLYGMEEEYKDFYDYFNSHKIYVSDFLKSDIGKTEFAEALQKNLSNITRDATKGIDLNSYWEELTDRFPSILPQGIDNAADQVVTALQKINEVREQIKPISVQELVGEDYSAALKSIKNNIVNSLGEAKETLLNEANKIYNTPQNGIAPTVTINEESIVTQIQSAIRKASKIEYEPLNIDISVNTKKIKSNLTEKLKGIDLSELSDTFAQFKNISFDAEPIIQIANAVSVLGKKSATAGIDNIPKLTNALKDMLSIFGEIPNIDSSIVQMTASLAELAKNGKTLSSAMEEIKNASNSIGNIVEPNINLGNAKESLESFAEALRRYDDIIERGGEETEAGTLLPIRSLEMGLEQLRELYPEARDLIESYEAEIERVQEIASKSAPILQYESIDLSPIESIREKTEEAIDGIREKTSTLSKEMLHFMDSLNNLEIPEIKEDNLVKLQKMLEKSELGLEKLRTKLENGITMGKIIESPDNKAFRNIQENIAITEKTVEAIKEKIKEVSAESEKAAAESAEAIKNSLANLQIPEIRTNSLEKLQKMLAKAESDLDKFKTKLQNDITMGKIKEDFGDKGYVSGLRQISETEKKIEAIKEKMKTADSAAGKTGGYDKLAKSIYILMASFQKLESTLQKTTNAIKKFASNAKKLISSGIKGIKDEVKKAETGLFKLVKAMQDMRKSSSGTNKSLMDNVKTMLKYTLGIRSLFMLIRKLKSAFKDGMQNLVQYSSEVNHSVSLMTSGLLSLKNGLAAAFSPIVNVIAPYIDILVDKLLSAVNAIGRFFAALTGKSIAVQAKKAYKNYADSINGVGSAAKDAAKAIGTIGIDELNILNENKPESGGGAGAGAGIEDMFEDVAIEKEISDWANRIRDAFISQDWEELGKVIAELANSGLKKVYDGINDITPKVEQALKNFAKVFNSFVEYLDWELLGRTIGAGVNLITNSVNALLGDEGINFENLGKKLSVGFRGMVDEIDWTGLGNAIGNWFMVSWRIADGFISDMWRVSADTMRNGWEELGIAVGEAVNGVFDRIKFDQIARVLTEGFRGILEALANALGTIKFDMIADKINAGLDVLASGLDWEHIGGQITKLTSAISKAFNDLLGLDFGAVGRTIGNGITDIVRAFNQLTGENGINFEQLGAKISDGLRNLFGSIPWKEFGNSLGNGFMIGWRVLDGFVTSMAQKDGAGITGWAQLGISIGNAINGIFEKIDFGTIGAFLANAFNGLIEIIRNTVETIDWNSIATNLTQGLNNFIHGVNWAEAGKTLSDLVMKLLDVFWEVTQNTDWESLGKGIGDFLSNIDWGGILEKVFDTIKTTLWGLIDGLSETSAGKIMLGVGTMVQAFKGLSSILPIITQLFGKNGAIIATVATLIASLAVVLAVGGKDLVDALFSLANSILDNLIDAVKKIDWSNVWHNIVSGLGAIISGSMEIIGKIVALAVELVGHLISGLLEYIVSGKVLSDLAEFALNLIQGIIKGVMSVISSLADVVKAIFDAIYNGLKKIFGIHSPSTVMSEIGVFIMQGLINGISSLIDKVISIMVGIKDKIAEVWQNVGKFLLETWDNIKKWASEKFGNIGKAISDSWEKTKKNAQETWSNIKTFLGDTWDGLKTWASEKFENLKDNVAAVWGGLKQKTSDTWSEIKTFLSETWDKLKSWAVEKFEGIKSAIASSLEGMREKTNEIWSGIRDFLGKTWDNIKDWASEKFENTRNVISQSWERAKENAQEAWGSIKDFLGQTWDTLTNWASEKFTNLKDAVAAVWGGLKQKTSDTWSEIKTFLSETWDKLKSWAVEKFSDIKEKISNAWQATKEKTSETWENMKNTIGNRLSETSRNIFEKFSEIKRIIGDILSSIINFINGVFTGSWRNAWNGVVGIFKNVFNMIPSIAEGVINAVIRGVNGIIGGINKVISLVPGNLIPNIPDIPTVSLPRFAAGGFPEDGLFLANHNELVGRFANGQTAVANNAQIVEGIKYGVREAVAEVLAPYLADIAQNTRETADKDMSVRIGDRDIVNSYNRGSNRMGYSF